MILKNVELPIQKFANEDSAVTPIIFTDKQRELFRRLDEFYKIVNNSKAYLSSAVLRGGFVAMSPVSRQINPDWLSQSAHSFRDIIYPFNTKNGKIAKDGESVLQKDKAFEKYGSVGKTNSDIGIYFGFFSNLAHHNFDDAIASNLVQINTEYREGCKNCNGFSPFVFEKIVKDFENLLFDILCRQVDVHKEIDGIIMNFDKIEEILSLNDDARRYFFAKANSQWLDWLWQNGFLNAIKQKSTDSTKYSYTLPELDYLIQMAAVEPQKVTDIILNVDMSKDNFNPEVVDRFLWICSGMSAVQIAQLVDKIKNEEWVKLMAPFSRWGFEYEKMFKELVKEKEYDGLLKLAEAVLTVRNQAERDQNSNFSDNPFYINSLDQTEVFDHLASVDDKHAEQAFSLLLNILSSSLKTTKKSESEYFDFKENFYLFDVDFFTVDLSVKNHLSIRENIHDLAAVITRLAKRLFDNKCENAEELHDLYIKNLLNIQSFYRFRLYIWSFCPDSFKSELKKAFFDVFINGDKYYELYCPEYCRALKNCFRVLNEEEKRIYVKQIFEYFGKNRVEKKEERIYKSDGWEILSSIFDNLIADEKNKAKEIFGNELDYKFEPVAGYGPITGGMVRPQAPIALPELNKMEIVKIVEKLCAEWSPKKLYEKDKERDFLNPLNGEGMANMLIQDIASRPMTYLANYNLFFQREVLDQHYTYAFIHGFEEVIRKDDFKNDLDLEKLLDLFDVIKNSAQVPFISERKRDEFGSAWLVDWGNVHNEIATILKILLSERSEKPLINFSNNRERVLSLIEYLLKNSDPNPESEKIENGSDPYSHAINSVRGRAFESLSLFAYLDGKKYPKEVNNKIDNSTKQIYEQVLEKENTYALMFMFGRYLPTFYYRDKNWVRGLLGKIFPIESEKHDLFIASLEGYLSADLYDELFKELSDVVYKRAIDLTDVQYTKRKYFREIDGGLATHLALAYVHYDNFDFDSSVFKRFWQTSNIKRHEEFISFIGRHLISRDDPDNFMIANSIDKEKIKKKLEDLWVWILNNSVKGEDVVFANFSFWVSEKQMLFTDLKWLANHLQKSFEKSGGDMKWEHGIIEKLSDFALVSPEETLKIIELYLMFQITTGPGHYTYFSYGDNGTKALKILYQNPVTKSGVEKLINDLLIKGSNRFWDFKKVLE